jgi:hypothetical protein
MKSKSQVKNNKRKNVHVNVPIRGAELKKLAGRNSK